MDNTIFGAESASSRSTRVPADAIPTITPDLGTLVPAELRSPVSPLTEASPHESQSVHLPTAMPEGFRDGMDDEQPDTLEISSDTASEVADLPDLSEVPFGMDGPQGFDFLSEPTASTEVPRLSPLASAFGLPAEEPAEDLGALPIATYIDPEDPGYAALTGQADPITSLNPLDDLSGFAPDAHLPPLASAMPSSQRLLTPEEQAAAVAKIIEIERTSAQDNDIVLEIYPLEKLEANLREACQNAATPEIAEIVISHIRQAVHETVTTNPDLKEPANSGAGVHARLEALRAIDDALRATVHPFLDKLSAEGVNVMRLGKALDVVITAEKTNLKDMEKSLVPQTLGNRIFSGLMDQTQKLFAGPSPLAGELRRRRDNDLRHSLKELEAVTKELRANAKNEEWMRSTGPQAMALAESLMVHIGESTKGVEKQIDHVALDSALNVANSTLKQAADETNDQAVKERIRQIVEAFNAFIERLTAVVRKSVGLAAKEAGTGQPAMRPMPRGMA